MKLDFGALRSLLKKRPGKATWTAIRKALQAIDPADSQEFLDTLRPYCEEHLRAWPDHIARDLPDVLLKTLWSADGPHPALAFTDALGLYRVTGESHERAIRAVSALGPLPLLRHLTLVYCEATHVQLALWLNALRGAGLTSLTLHNNPIDRLTALLDSPLAAQLTALDLFGSSLQDRHAAAMILAPSLSGLRSLDLLSAGIGPQTAAALGARDALPSLASLNIGSSELEDEQVGALINSSRPALTTLIAGNNQLTDLTAERLADPANLPGLRDLNLWFNQLSDVGAAALLRSPRMATLERLNLGSNRRVDPAIFADQLADLHAPDLRHLSINSLNLTGALMARVADSPLLAHITALDLSHNRFGDEGARALAASPHLTQLTSLRIQSCDIGPDGVAALMDAPWAPNLTNLELSMNPIADRGAEALAAGPCAKLDSLLLGATDTTDVGYAALAASATLPNKIRRAYAR
jgi:Leucine-rich repeat (LRR) protein